MSDIDHTRDCILPSNGKAEGLVKASELFALAAERDALRAENEKLRAALLTGVLMLSEMGLDPREKCEMAYEYMSAALGGKDE